jgi:UDP-N-acetyl-2-amino-2-deoxyglucuronate dehydrogenase
MNNPEARPTFALIGVAGYIARRHLAAIRDVGCTLTACHDITDSVGILDSYFPDARFFTDGARFEDFIGQPGSRPDYFVVCTPNDLHAEHTALGLRVGAQCLGV